MRKVTIYTTPTCTFCRMAKDFFKTNGVEYAELDVASGFEARKKMLEISKQMGVPVIDIDGNIVVGFNKPELSQLLGL